MAELKNRVALVTGGSRGIGKAVALALAEAGAAVAVNYQVRAEDAKAVVEAIQKNNGRAATFAADVSLGSDVKTMVQEIEERLGPIDILVNNAGIAISRNIEEITEEDFERTIAVNLKSVFLCTQAVLPGMQARRWGRIVNISSIGARIGSSSASVAYGASKAGVEGLTRSYALRVAPKGGDGQCGSTGPDRHGDGQAAGRGRFCRAHSGQARGRRRGNRAGDLAARE
jgi:3-oxoacyl-[acyl-carrier protein] reductase